MAKVKIVRANQEISKIRKLPKNCNKNITKTKKSSLYSTECS